VKISVCIPNYNYERYLGRTLESVLLERDVELEVVIADNASTDRSVALIEAAADPRVRVKVNACNVGFAGNLDRAARMASGDWLIMLSSDDLVRPGTLKAYHSLSSTFPRPTIVTSTMDQIDPDDVVTGRLGPDPELWMEADRDPALSGRLGAPVYRVPTTELLRRSLLSMKNPFNFAATCYRRADYEAVEGYGGARLINPDKWFHWRLLGQAEDAIWIDAPLFAYRWHPQNQTAQQASQGALKYLIDQYANVLELSDALLRRAGVSRDQLTVAFVRHDIANHGLATLARGDRARAERTLAFGMATFPAVARGEPRAAALRALLATGPLAAHIAKPGYRAWQRARG
jgi:glycosyltransferase involved in cell wall biosynthesis